jgi:hypothetical protein
MEKEEKEKDEKVESPNNVSKDIVWNTSLNRCGTRERKGTNTVFRGQQLKQRDDQNLRKSSF